MAPRKCALMLAVLIAAAVPLGSHAEPIARVGWTPVNAGVLWWQPNDPNYPISPPRQPPGEPTGAWWLTRRIAPSPHHAGIVHLGSFFHGLYVSAGGGAWTTLTPGCWLPVNAPQALSGFSNAYQVARRAAIAVTGLDACGIEGIVYDPALPNRIYASAYDVVSLVGYNATLGDGGVYVSDDLGVTWRKLLGGIRGNGLAVQHTIGRPTMIAAGYIQTGSAVGPTPNNGSVSISRDDGRTWADYALPASGCSDIVVSSQRITPTIAIDPWDPNRMYLGTNAGLYDGVYASGKWTFTLRKQACGGVWGIALSRDGSQIIIGDKDGVISRAATDTMAFTPVVDLGAGKVQSVILDADDPDYAYAAVWDGGDARVFRVNLRSPGSARLDDSLLSDLVPVDQAWPTNIPKPFPLTFRARDGSAPSLFLAQQPLYPSTLYVSTILRGVFARLD